MVMETRIRTAAPADAALLAGLRYDFRSRHAPAVEDRGEFLARCEKWMSERLRPDSRWRCWIAERDDGAAIGDIWLNLIEKVPNPAPEAEYHAYITNFYVLEEARGQGTGTKLLGIALEWCKVREVHAAILWPSDRSRRLYERNGFAVRNDLLELIVTS
jgi:GNAT superfamily N-acetyltransferase